MKTDVYMELHAELWALCVVAGWKGVVVVSRRSRAAPRAAISRTALGKIISAEARLAMATRRLWESILFVAGGVKKVKRRVQDVGGWRRARVESVQFRPRQDISFSNGTTWIARRTRTARTAWPWCHGVLVFPSHSSRTIQRVGDPWGWPFALAALVFVAGLDSQDGELGIRATDLSTGCHRIQQSRALETMLPARPPPWLQVIPILRGCLSRLSRASRPRNGPCVCSATIACERVAAHACFSYPVSLFARRVMEAHSSNNLNLETLT